MNHECFAGLQCDAARRVGLAILLLAATMPGSQAEEVPSAPAASQIADQTNAASAGGQTAYKKMSLEELMNLDVTSVSRQAEPYGQAPAAIQVVTQDEIRRSGASSIPEALRLADNLEVAQKNSHDWGISARGFNTDLANKLLVLMDGRTLYTPLFSGVFWNVQDYLLEDIDRIEVISGPGGTLWGANAVNGVINITTKSARDTQGLYVEGGGGTELRYFAGVRYGGTLASNVYYRVYGKYFDRGNEVFPNGSDASDSWAMGQGGFRIDSYASPQNVLTLQGDGYGSGVNVPTGGQGMASGGNILGRWSHTISDDSDTSLQLYYDRTHLYDPISNQFGTANILKDDLDTYDLDFQHRFRLGERHRFVWGVGYRFTHDELSQAANLAFLPSPLDHNLFSIFAQDEILLVKNLYLTLGTKLEHNDYTGYEWEPSGRLQWNITSNQMTTLIPLFFANNLEGYTYGAEFSATYQVSDWWRLHGGYDLLEEHLRVEAGQSDINNALNETSDPKHQISFRSSMDLPQNVELDAGLRWVDTLHNNNGGVVGTVPSYFELDARLGWRPVKNLELSFVGQNLLHDQHPEFGAPSPTREVIVRSFYGKMSWRF